MMPRRICVAVLLASAFLFAQKPPNNDDRIYDEVRRRLVGDQEVKGGAIEVDVKDGVVTLRGVVREEKQKTKAEKLTKKVKGVTRVMNALAVRPTGT